MKLAAIEDETSASEILE